MAIDMEKERRKIAEICARADKAAKEYWEIAEQYDRDRQAYADAVLAIEVQDAEETDAATEELKQLERPIEITAERRRQDLEKFQKKLEEIAAIRKAGEESVAAIREGRVVPFPRK